MFRRSTVLCSACFALASLVLTMPVQAEQLILQYSFPSSWDGSGDPPQVVTDLSPAGNNGMTSGGAALTVNVPPGAPDGSSSLNAAGEGGILTDNVNLLENPAVEAAGGFELSTWFFWDGNDGNRTVQKIIDNEGTESLQLANIDSANNTADLVFSINDSPGPTLPIVANTWYEASAAFDTQGNAIDVDGNLAGLATLSANGASVFQNVIRSSGSGSSSDDFDRPIAIGVLALPAAPTLVNFSGDIYNPTVRLIPEPAGIGLAWFALAVICLSRRRP